jgi:hypothetical protein
MEYLMTYGWAILIIAIVLVAFFSLNLFNPYTFSPKASPGSCQILRPNGPGSNIFVSAVGPTCTTNEIPQYVAQFNGQVGSNVTLPDISNPDINISISLWWNPSLINNYYGAVALHNNGGYGIELLMNSGSRVYSRIDTPTSFNYGCINNTQALSKNQWYFVVVTATTTGSNTISQCFTNALPGAINTFPGLLPTSYTNNRIGTGSPNGYGLPWPGMITNVQIYNTSLSQPEITALYQEGIGGAPTNIQNLVGWWPLNGNSNDYSGNGNNGVPTNVIFTSSWESGYTAP